MSDLTDKLVDAVQKGQLDLGEVVSRLTPEEKNDFSASMERFAQGEVNREDQALGSNKWLARGGMGLGAGAAAAALPASIGGAGLMSTMGPGALAAGRGLSSWAASNPIPAGLATWGIGKLLGMPAELRDLAAMMVGLKHPVGAMAPAAATAVESKLPGEIERILPQTDAEFAAANGRNRGELPARMRQPAPDPPNLSRQAGMEDIESRVQGGGGVHFENNGTPVRPNGPISQKGSDRPGTVTRRPPSDALGSEEADKRKVMFGGANVKTDVSKKADLYNTGRETDKLVEGYIDKQVPEKNGRKIYNPGGMPAEPKAASRRSPSTPTTRPRSGVDTDGSGNLDLPGSTGKLGADSSAATSARARRRSPK